MRLSKWLSRCLALTLVILTAAAPCALADFAAYVSSKSTVVYADSGMTKKLGTLPKKTVVVVRSYEGSVAKVSCAGKTGYAAASDLKALDGEARTVEVRTSTRAYAKPSTQSRSIALKKGTEVTLLAASGKCALIEKGGYIGYTYLKHLSTGGASTADQAADTGTSGSSGSSGSSGAETTGSSGSSGSSGAETTGSSGSSSAAEIIDSGKYGNEEAIYLYLTKVMGLNTAAAAGILSNIKSESSFRPTAYNSGGGSYGICQWTGSRYTRLKNYCANRDLDYTSLSAQLAFLDYELENYYPKVLKYLRGVSNTADGAYDAGHYYCYHFEAPANRANVSVKRGNAARNTYWAKYA